MLKAWEGLLLHMVVDPLATAPTAPEAPVAFTRWPQWFFTAALLTLVADLVSKQVLFALPRDAALPSFIERAYNKGVAWSLFAEHPWLVVGLTVVLIPVLAVVWWRQYRLISAWENLAFGCILGGAVGNAYDRVLTRLGELDGVRDFIFVDLGFKPFDPWPTFNLADSGICIGFALLVLRSFFTAKS
jgi:signal peptidase II